MTYFPDTTMAPQIGASVSTHRPPLVRWCSV